MSEVRTWITVEEFKGHLERGRRVPEGVGLRKTFVADSINAVPGSRELTFRITTGAVDREGDTIAPSGWDLEAYKNNPVVMWAHDCRSLPVGRATAIERAPNGLRSTAEFTTADLNPFGDTVYRMLKAGFLRATSVGFAPTKWDFNKERKGVDFQAQELLEWSICPVPANAEALMEAAAKGIDVAPLREWAEGILARPPVQSRSRGTASRPRVFDIESDFLVLNLEEDPPKNPWRDYPGTPSETIIRLIPTYDVDLEELRALVPLVHAAQAAEEIRKQLPALLRSLTGRLD